MFPIIIFTMIGLSAAQICPPPEVLYPCVCVDSADLTMIGCSGIQEHFNLKEVMDNASAFITDDVIFDVLFIYDTSISKIEEAAFQQLKFHEIGIHSNKNLTHISPRAFNASRDITKEIVIWENPIENETPYERDIFDFFNSFKNLEQITLFDGRVSSIPDDAVQNMTSLKKVWLEGNSIFSIGRRAFSTLPGLESLWLQNNAISSEGIHEDAFHAISGLFDVVLWCNEIDYLEQKRFQPILDLTQLVFVGGDDTICPYSEFARFHCDHRAGWICDNEEIYRVKLIGFSCKNGTGFDDIWDYCRSRKNTFHV